MAQQTIAGGTGVTWLQEYTKINANFTELYGFGASDWGAVGTTGNQTVAGVKTFTSFPITPDGVPDTDYQVANKKYVDDSVSGGVGGGLSWSVVSSNTTAADGRGYLVDCSGGAVTITCPATPSEGDKFGVVDLGDSETNNITIDRNGSNIMGAASNKTIATDNQGITLVYANASKGWVVVSETNLVIW